MIIQRQDFEQLSDEVLQEAEDLINELQAERRTAHPIDIEREALVNGIGKFFKKLKGCDSLDAMWK